MMRIAAAPVISETNGRLFLSAADKKRGKTRDGSYLLNEAILKYCECEAIPGTGKALPAMRKENRIAISGSGLPEIPAVENSFCILDAVCGGRDKLENQACPAIRAASFILKIPHAAAGVLLCPAAVSLPERVEKVVQPVPFQEQALLHQASQFPLGKPLGLEPCQIFLGHIHQGASLGRVFGRTVHAERDVGLGYFLHQFSQIFRVRDS
ncbi:hypothetical protein HMPREF1326_00908 [Akkermansia sp. KLE1605]|nr:hypothetical protein HMPREF1326_00908 [Akkermansia sp. KLE1605]